MAGINDVWEVWDDDAWNADSWGEGAPPAPGDPSPLFSLSIGLRIGLSLAFLLVGCA